MAAAGDKREKRKNYFYSEYEREYFDYLLDRTKYIILPGVCKSTVQCTVEIKY